MFNDDETTEETEEQNADEGAEISVPSPEGRDAKAKTGIGPDHEVDEDGRKFYMQTVIQNGRPVEVKRYWPEGR